jgi:hypothetical protein
MRFFDTDWNMILRWLEVWEKVPLAARRCYLEAKSHAESVAPERYGAELGQVLSLGLVEQTSKGTVRPTKASMPFRALMVQLAKWHLFEGKPERRQLEEYLHKHYIAHEQQTLRAWEQPGWDSRERPESFLEAKKIRAWEESLLSYYEVNGQSSYGWGASERARPKNTWFPTPETVEAARFLVRTALESKRPWLLKDLAQEVPEPLRPALDSALTACLRHALLFAALSKDSFELVIGVCPFILYMANRPAPVPPATEPCAEATGVAFLVEDLTQVLALAATNECFLNQGSSERQFFKSVETRLQQEFVPVPAWIGDVDFFQRLRLAAEVLLVVHLATDTCRKEPKRRLKPTAAGRKWLAQSPADRLKDLLFECQPLWKGEDWANEEDSEVLFEDDLDDDDDLLDGFEDAEEGRLAVPVRCAAGRKPDLLQWQKSVWRQAPTEQCVSLQAFLDYHARVSLPGAAVGQPKESGANAAAAAKDPDDTLAAEELRRRQLDNFFWRVLVPFGCVEAVRHGPRDLLFRLSPTGQYLAGLKRTVQYGPEGAEAPIVVQPNFEIVFLGPDLGAEVALASFAERCGRNAGTLFRLTRPKMILAASRGATAEKVLATLAKFASKPVPENVVAEVRAWFASCRTVTVRRSTLLQAPDAETGLRIKQLLGSQCAQLSATLLEWPEPDLPSGLVNKLREQGVFLDETSPQTAE